MVMWSYNTVMKVIFITDILPAKENLMLLEIETYSWSLD